MTRVCLVGEEGQHLSYELLSRETAREALAAYDLREPYDNTVAVETVSLGAAVSLLNDLEWYLVRFVREAMVLEPSVSEDEWLSRDLATAIRDGELEPGETGRLLKVYGLEYPDDGSDEVAEGGSGTREGGETAEGDDGGEEGGGGMDGGEEGGGEMDGGEEGGGEMDDDEMDGDETAGAPPRLVEPMFVARTGGGLPEYDLRDVDETLLVRVTEDEFKA